jgi:hypothetical protein
LRMPERRYGARARSAALRSGRRLVRRRPAVGKGAQPAPAPFLRRPQVHQDRGAWIPHPLSLRGGHCLRCKSSFGSFEKRSTSGSPASCGGEGRVRSVSQGRYELSREKSSQLCQLSLSLSSPSSRRAATTPDKDGRFSPKAHSPFLSQVYR